MSKAIILLLPTILFMSRVAYIWSKELQAASDQLPANIGRSSLVHGLIGSLGLLDGAVRPKDAEAKDEKGDGVVKTTTLDKPIPREGDKMKSRIEIVSPDPDLGGEEDLKRYHDSDYVDYLLKEYEEEDKDGDDHNDQEESDSTTSSYSYSHSHCRLPPSKRSKYNNVVTSKPSKSTLHGLEYDCPRFPLLPTYVRLITSSTLTACRALTLGKADIAIHWDGGRHHALRNRASGFCYVADVVLGIMALVKDGVRLEMEVMKAGNGNEDESAEKKKQKGNAVQVNVKGEADGEMVGEVGKKTESRRKPGRPRVMYLDLDLHYGDGVAHAFHSPRDYSSPNATSTSVKLNGASDQTKTKPPRPPRPPQVLTLSIHYSSPLFFPPPTPHSLLPEPTTPSPFTLSIPLSAYPSTHTYARVYTAVDNVRQAFEPDYVVLQLGADGLPRDPVGLYGCWGIEGEGGLRWWVQKVRGWGVPLCVLGGGGYDHPNTSRAWAVATAVLTGQDLPSTTDVPDHDHFPSYAPSFTLEIPESHVEDENTSESLDLIDETFRVIAFRISTIMQHN